MSLKHELDEILRCKPHELAEQVATIAELREETMRDRAEIDDPPQRPKTALLPMKNGSVLPE